MYRFISSLSQYFVIVKTQPVASVNNFIVADIPIILAINFKSSVGNLRMLPYLSMDTFLVNTYIAPRGWGNGLIS